MPHTDPEARREYQRAYRERHRAKLQAYRNAWRRNRYATDPEYRAGVLETSREILPHVHAAHMRVYKALKRGELVRPDRCEACGRRVYVEAAHTNYYERLAIHWLCRPCHREWDAQQPKALEDDPRRYVPEPATHCKNGHPFAGDNLYVNARGHRHCRQCRRDALARLRERRRS